MMDLASLKNFFPPLISDNPAFRKYMLKEYILLAILDFLSSSVHAGKLIFIGGTNLRLVKGIDRFSEDLDFDCKNFSEEEFMNMTDSVLHFLQRMGFKPEVRDRENHRLQAFRRNIYFPQLLYDLRLTAHREERFLVKIECQDQLVEYRSQLANIRGCGFFFPFPVPPDPVLCSMKLAALLTRSKGRDFYDAMFLLGQTAPDYGFLASRCGITDPAMLKNALMDLAVQVDLANKARDFEHLVFEPRYCKRILGFGDFVNGLPGFAQVL